MCVFYKKVVYLRGIIVNRRTYMQSTSDQPSALDQIKSSGVPIYTGYIWKSESRKKMTTIRWRLIVGISQETEKHSKVMSELIENMNEWVFNHPQVVNSPISNDTLLVPDPDWPGNKIRVSKLLLQISIYELHNDLIYESSIYKLK